ncbi:MAG: polyprenyl synthetase family protein [Candidatus Micrarchaeota archaeon]
MGEISGASVSPKKTKFTSSVYSFMRETSERVNPKMLEYLEPLRAENPSLYDVVAHLPKIKVGENNRASMLRPTLVRLGYEAGGGKDFEAVLPLATAVELLNISTYVIDDVFDNCDLRHNEITVHRKYGDNNAIIAGMLLRELAGKAVHDASEMENFAEISKLFTDTHYVIYSGQYSDLKMNTHKQISEETYFDRTYKITGAFIQNCILLGALAARADEKTARALSEFGKYYGIAVQIRNDLMDFVIPSDNPSYSRGFKGISHNDLKEGKMTLPVLHALGVADEEQREFIMSALGDKSIDNEKLRELNDLLARLGSFGYTKGVIEAYGEKAAHALADLPESEAKRNLTQLVLLLGNIENWMFI